MRASASFPNPLPITQGGTGQLSVQAAIDALTAVSGATNEHVLTKDTGTGTAIFKAAAAGLWTNSSTNDYQTSTTNSLIIGATTPVNSARVTIDGNADKRQMVVQGHSTQSSNIFEVLKSDLSVLFSVSNTSGIVVGGTTSAIGSLDASTALLMNTAWCDKVITLADGATPALDASLGNIFSLTAAGNRTIAVPSNATSGQKIVIRHIASGAARTVALNTGAGGFRFGETVTALTETTSGKTDYIGAIYNSTATFWDVVSYDKGH